MIEIHRAASGLPAKATLVGTITDDDEAALYPACDHLIQRWGNILDSNAVYPAHVQAIYDAIVDRSDVSSECKELIENLQTMGSIVRFIAD